MTKELNVPTHPLEIALDPRRWTDEMSLAWHAAMPNLFDAFAALREHATAQAAIATQPVGGELPPLPLLEAAQDLLTWIEAKHRPPTHDNCGTMALVRLHALATLADSVAATIAMQPVQQPAAVDLSSLHRYDLTGDGACFAPSDGSYVLYDDLAVLLASVSAPVAGQDTERLLREYLLREMPSGTVINDPTWWAPRIARVVAPVPAPVAAPVVGQEPVGMFYEDACGLLHQVDPDIAKAYPDDPSQKPLYTAPVPAAGVHDAQEQAYIGQRLRRVAKAAGVTVDYGDDAFYYGGAFSILGDIARALEKPAAGVQGDVVPAAQPVEGFKTDFNKGWSLGFNACRDKVIENCREVCTTKDTCENHGCANAPIAATPQPDSGRDAVLTKCRQLLGFIATPGSVYADFADALTALIFQPAAHPAPSSDAALLKAAHALLDEHKEACLTDPMYALVEMAEDDEEATVSAVLLAYLFRALAGGAELTKDDASEMAISAAMAEGNRHGVNSTVSARIVAAYIAAHPAPSSDAALPEIVRHALEMVDGCMDVTQVEPEDAAAWQIVRKLIAAHPANGAQAGDAGLSGGVIATMNRVIDCLEILNKHPRPMCRDCADECGICPHDGLDCDMRKLLSDARAILAAAKKGGA